ncbi:MAG: cyclic pyranopterin monophosphate synthase MoaC [Chlamydiota bacterium]
MGRTLSHVDSAGRVRMVDVGGKPDAAREAVARGAVVMKPATLSRIARGGGPKGDVFNTARIAGILAAKRVDQLIPLCHPLAVTHVSVDFILRRGKARARVEITARARTVGRTGVEMEALAAVAIAALTIYDMCKAVDGGMRLTDIRLVEKTKRAPV